MFFSVVVDHHEHFETTKDERTTRALLLFTGSLRLAQSGTHGRRIAAREPQLEEV